METTTAFVLNDAIVSWRDGLRLLPSLCQGDIAELEEHLRDAMATWQNLGLTEEEAFLLATRRLGHPAGLQSEFAKINHRQVWLNRLLWMVIGIQGWNLLFGVAHLATDTTVLGGLAGLGYIFPSSAPGQFYLSLGTAIPVLLFLLAQLLAVAGCIGACGWLALRKEHTIRERIAKALRRPVLVGLCLVALSTLLGSLSAFEVQLLHRFCSVAEFGAILTSKSLAAIILSPLQIIGLVVLTILLLRRRFRLSSAS